jgi:GNAT superfamily N-acetyltransferase
MHELAVECYGPRAEPRDWWEWRYFGVGARESRIVLAQRDGLVVGMQVVTMERFGGSGDAVGGVLTGGMVHPGHRRRGIFRQVVDAAVRQAVECGAKVALTFPNNQSAPAFRRFGWTNAGDRAAVARWVLPRFRRQGGGFAGIRVEERAEIGAELQRLDQKVYRGRGLWRVERGNEWVNWRFGGNPLVDYVRLVAFGAGGDVRGVVVVGMSKVSHSRIGFLLEALAAERAVLIRLLRTACDRLRARGVGILVGVFSDPVALRELGKTGFIRLPAFASPKRFHTAVLPLRKDGPAQVPTTVDQYALSLSDWDGI